MSGPGLSSPPPLRLDERMFWPTRSRIFQLHSSFSPSSSVREALRNANSVPEKGLRILLMTSLRAGTWAPLAEVLGLPMARSNFPCSPWLKQSSQSFLPIVAFIKDEWVNSLLIQTLRKEGILQEKAALSRAYCRFIKCCSVEACRKPVLTSRLHKLYLSSQWSVYVWCFSRPVCSLSSPLPQLWAILTFLIKVCQICKRKLQSSVFPAWFIPKPGFPGFELMRYYGDRANKHQGLNLCAQVFDVSYASSNESFTCVS